MTSQNVGQNRSNRYRHAVEIERLLPSRWYNIRTVGVSLVISMAIIMNAAAGFIGWTGQTFATGIDGSNVVLVANSALMYPVGWNAGGAYNNSTDRTARVAPARVAHLSERAKIARPKPMLTSSDADR